MTNCLHICILADLHNMLQLFAFQTYCLKSGTAGLPSKIRPGLSVVYLPACLLLFNVYDFYLSRVVNKLAPVSSNTQSALTVGYVRKPLDTTVHRASQDYRKTTTDATRHHRTTVGCVMTRHDSNINRQLAETQPSIECSRSG